MRPTHPEGLADRARELRREGLSYAAIQRRLWVELRADVGWSTIKDWIKRGGG